MHTMTQHKQKGFTLVEIAVVLVIIGLLLGAILQGQSLIQSARVNNLADQQAGIQAAYYGFIDRYRAVPGDMPGDDAQSAIGIANDELGDYSDCGDDSYPGGSATGQLPEPAEGTWCVLNAVWVHLSDAGFIRGSYKGSGDAPGPGNSDVSPLNSFNAPVVLARHDGYEGSSTERLVYHFGNQVEAAIARELDVKLDDGRPQTGSLRQSSSGDGPHESQTGDACMDGNEWDVEVNPDSCNPVFIF